MIKPLPASIADVAALEEMLSEPSTGLIEIFGRIEGDILVLGAAGKMGPTLCRMARRAADEAGVRRRVIAVSRFSDPGEMRRMTSWGIETIKADLLDERELASLPDASNVVFMAGMKFGATGNEPLTWAMNTHVPAMVLRKYAASRFVAFSTGNVYGMSPVVRGGSVESDPPAPDGDYAMSCLGRERIFQHFSKVNRTEVVLVRLNYASEMRYGVLFDLAQKVWREEPVPLAMGALNAIWQGDANAMALAALQLASSPALVLNLAGPEQLSVRRICQEFGAIMGKAVSFVGEEATDALLSNGQLAHQKLGYPGVCARQMIAWTADWVMRGGASAGKPTHFETRDGRY